MYSSFVLISEIFVSFDAESMDISPVTPVTVSHLTALPVTRDGTMKNNQDFQSTIITTSYCYKKVYNALPADVWLQV